MPRSGASPCSAGLTGPRVDQPLNVRLGYPAASKLLSINADDLGMSQRDVDVMSGAEFRKALADNHVILIGWRAIQKLMQR